MSTSGSYDPATKHRDLESEIQRLHTQAILSWRKEARTLAWFGLRDGMSVLELGSGPGFITEQLLTLVPTGSVTAVEVDPVLLQRAEQYLRGKADGRLHLVEGSVLDMRLPDNSYDFAVARFLFQHLPDPLAAAQEVLRVLKPGGKLVIIDADDALAEIMDPAIPALQRIVAKWSRTQATQGGDRHVGRRLWRILKDAGFHHLDLEAVVVHSDDVGMQQFLPQIDPDRLVPAVQAGVISERELRMARALHARFLASPGSLLLILLLIGCGEKP
jgi:ubiquinone/menaquinone biosynthesis C-methylase UbiE